jgi:ethanolamine utilization protein EutP
MRKIILIGRTGCGKTTLTQALKGEKIQYHKTQYVNHFNVIIDTPGEYAENRELARALILYSYEADVIGLLLNATEGYSLYSPNIAAGATREVVGIVTQIDRKNARPDLAENWLSLAGCKKVFHISSVTGEGIPDILNYLREPGDVMPWENKVSILP